ncbi:MAG: hypothetical protein WKG03_06915 [Telluria sp.]
MQTPSLPVPGRLRLRFTQLKQQTEQLMRMAEALHAVGGVLTVETSPPIGALLIHYDAVVGKTTAFWDQIEAVLLAHQLLLDPRPLGRHPSPKPPHPAKGAASSAGGAAAQHAGKDSAPAPKPRNIASTLAARLADGLVDRCAVALVAALR